MLLELGMITLAAAAMPLWLVMALLLLRSPGGERKALAFAAGAAAMRLLQGVLFGVVFSGVPAGEGRSVLVDVLLLILGLLLLTLAYRKWRKEDDPDEPPKWMATLSGLTTVKALGMGALLMLVAMKHWVFTLSAIAVIEQAQPGLATAALAYLAFVLLAQILLIVPIVASAVAPDHTGRVLAAVGGWVDRNSRLISIGLSLIFGIWFLWKSITGLMS